MTGKKVALVWAVLMAAGLGIGAGTARATNITWTTASNSTWLTAGNWSGGIPTGTDNAVFTATGVGTIGINMNGSTNNGSNNQAVGEISVTGSVSRTINNSSTTVAGTLTINGVSGTLLSDSTNSNNLTLANGSSKAMNVAFPNDGDITVTNSGATITISSNISGAANLSKSGAGVLKLTGTNSFGGVGTTFTITAGIVDANSDAALGDANTVWVLNGSSATFRDSQTTSTVTIAHAFQMGASGGTFDVAPVGGNLILTGNITGTGGLTRIASSGNPSNALTISGATVNYSGATNFNGGAVYVNTTLAGAGAVSVGASVATTLAGSGTITGATTVYASGAVQPGPSIGSPSPGTLTFTNGINFSTATSTYTWDLNAFSTENPGTDFSTINAGSGLTIAAGAQFGIVFTGTATSPDGATNAFWSTPHDWTVATSAATTGMFTLANTISNGTFSFNNTGTDLVLHYAPPSAAARTLAWAGVAGGGVADTDGTWDGATNNWVNTADLTNVTWSSANPNIAIFGAGAGAVGTATVTLAGLVTAGQINFAANSATYTLNSSTLTLQGVSGVGITAHVSATVNANVSLGAGQTWAVDGNCTLTVSGQVAGAFPITVAGPGVLALTGTSNSFAGLTIQGGGTVTAAGDGSLGIGAIAFDGGTLKTMAAIPTSAKAISITANGGTIDTNGFDSSFSGNISGAGALTKISAGKLTLGGNNSMAGLVVTGGTVAVAGDVSLGSAGVALSNGATLQITAPATLTRTITVGSGGATIDTGASNVTVSGITSAAANTLIKAGSGALTTNSALVSTLAIPAGSVNLAGSTSTSNLTADPGGGTFVGDLGVEAMSRVNFNSAGFSGGGHIYVDASGAALSITGNNALGVISNPIVLNRNAAASFVANIGAAGNADQSIASTNVLRIDADITGTADVNIATGAGTTATPQANGGAGTLLLSAQTHYVGRTILDNVYVASGTASVVGLLKLGTTDALPTNTDLVFGSTTSSNTTKNAGALDLAGYSQSVASLSTNYNSAASAYSLANGITNSTSTLATLTITGGKTTIYKNPLGALSVGTIAAGTTNDIALVLSAAHTGQLTLSNANTYSGGTTVAGGTLVVDNAAALGTGGLAIQNTAAVRVTAGGSKVIVLPSLTMDDAATLDLADNDMVVQGGDAGRIQTLINNGYDSGNYTTPGITTSSHTALTTLGTLMGSAYVALHGTTEFGSDTEVQGTDVLVKYTYTGDIDLDGLVTLKDYQLMDAGYLSGFDGVSTIAGWGGGDVTHDGMVDYRDFAAADAAAGQTTALGQEMFARHSAAFGAAYLAAFDAAVPEPATIGVLTLGAAGLLRRRRGGSR